MAAKSFSDPSATEFRREVQAWLGEVAPRFVASPDATEAEALELRRAWEIEQARSGYNCLRWPVEFGGRALGPIEDFIYSEECIAAGTPEGLGRIGRLLAGPALFGHGTEELRARLVPPILNGTDIWCQGFSEPNAGSDLASVRTSARRDGDVYYVNGQKVWTSFGHYADWCLLLARTGPADQRHRNLSMFAMPMHQPGVQARRIKQISGRGEFNEVFYDDAVVPAENRIGDENDGWRVAMTVLSAERGVGFGALALKDLSDYVGTLRHCLSGSAGARSLLTSLEHKVKVMRWQVVRAAELIAADRDSNGSASALKVTWSELEQRLVRIGFESDCAEHRGKWRYLEMDNRSKTIASGSSEIQRNIIARRVLGLPV
jgi:alkylation response protein AidB-like acyl-CoA dehydrogenase